MLVVQHRNRLDVMDQIFSAKSGRHESSKDFRHLWHARCGGLTDAWYAQIDAEIHFGAPKHIANIPHPDRIGAANWSETFANRKCWPIGFVIYADALGRWDHRYAYRLCEGWWTFDGPWVRSAIRRAGKWAGNLMPITQFTQINVQCRSFCVWSNASPASQFYDNKFTFTIGRMRAVFGSCRLQLSHSPQSCLPEFARRRNCTGIEQFWRTLRDIADSQLV